MDWKGLARMENEALLDHVADIVSAHVSNNAIAAADLPGGRPAAAEPDGSIDGLKAKFPKYNYDDMVEAQYRLDATPGGPDKVIARFAVEMDRRGAWALLIARFIPGAPAGTS